MISDFHGHIGDFGSQKNVTGQMSSVYTQQHSDKGRIVSFSHSNHITGFNAVGVLFVQQSSFFSVGVKLGVQITGGLANRGVSFCYKPFCALIDV